MTIGILATTQRGKYRRHTTDRSGRIGLLERRGVIGRIVGVGDDLIEHVGQEEILMGKGDQELKIGVPGTGIRLHVGIIVAVKLVQRRQWERSWGKYGQVGEGASATRARNDATFQNLQPVTIAGTCQLIGIRDGIIENLERAIYRIEIHRGSTDAGSRLPHIELEGVLSTRHRRGKSLRRARGDERCKRTLCQHMQGAVCQGVGTVDEQRVIRRPVEGIDTDHTAGSGTVHVKLYRRGLCIDGAKRSCNRRGQQHFLECAHFLLLG